MAKECSLGRCFVETSWVAKNYTDEKSLEARGLALIQRFERKLEWSSEVLRHLLRIPDAAIRTEARDWSRDVAVVVWIFVAERVHMSSINPIPTMVDDSCFRSEELSFKSLQLSLLWYLRSRGVTILESCSDYRGSRYVNRPRHRYAVRYPTRRLHALKESFKELPNDRLAMHPPAIFTHWTLSDEQPRCT